MKTKTTPPLSSFCFVKAIKTTAISIFIMAVSRKTHAQVPPTFTCNNIQVNNTITAMGAMETQSMTVNSTLTVVDDVTAQQDMKIDGTLYANGPAVFGGAVQVATLSGSGISQIYSDNNGMLFKGPSMPNAWACFTAAPAWNLGGNNMSAVLNTPFSQNIGTCDNYDFILKANNTQRMWIKPDGKIGFGISNPGSTSAPEYQFHQGVARLSGMNSFGGPQIIFDGGSYNGDWGIEYLPSSNTTTPGLNFWKPTGSFNSFNYLFFIADDGKVSVGNVTNPSSARFNVDAWNGNGIKTLCDQSMQAFTIYDKTSNAESFVIFGNGATHIAAQNAQIGFANSAIQDPGVALNINNQNVSGIKFNTNNPGINLICVNSQLPNQSVFTVKGNGRTYIGDDIVVGTHTDAMLQVSGKIACKSLFVLKPTDWQDRVFSPSYKLEELSKVENYILENNHLKGIPSEKEVLEDGYDVNEMDAKLLEKIENIFLYIIEQEKQMQNLKAEISELKKRLDSK